MQNDKHPIIYHPSYDIPLPEKHRFPGTKYSLLMKDLKTSGVIEGYLRYVPKACVAEHLSIAHDTSYIKAIETGNLLRVFFKTVSLSYSTSIFEGGEVTT